MGKFINMRSWYIRDLESGNSVIEVRCRNTHFCVISVQFMPLYHTRVRQGPGDWKNTQGDQGHSKGDQPKAGLFRLGEVLIYLTAAQGPLPRQVGNYHINNGVNALQLITRQGKHRNKQNALSADQKLSSRCPGTRADPGPTSYEVLHVPRCRFLNYYASMIKPKDQDKFSIEKIVFFPIIEPNNKKSRMGKPWKPHSQEA